MEAVEYNRGQSDERIGWKESSGQDKEEDSMPSKSPRRARATTELAASASARERVETEQSVGGSTVNSEDEDETTE